MRPVELRSTERENRKRRHTIYGAILAGFTAGLITASALYESMPPACAAEASATMNIKASLLYSCRYAQRLHEDCAAGDDQACSKLERAQDRREIQEPCEIGGDQ